MAGPGFAGISKVVNNRIKQDITICKIAGSTIKVYFNGRGNYNALSFSQYLFSELFKALS